MHCIWMKGLIMSMISICNTEQLTYCSLPTSCNSMTSNKYVIWHTQTAFQDLQASANHITGTYLFFVHQPMTVYIKFFTLQNLILKKVFRCLRACGPLIISWKTNSPFPIGFFGFQICCVWMKHSRLPLRRALWVLHVYPTHLFKVCLEAQN